MSKWEISLKCNETMPTEEKLDKVKCPDKACEHTGCRKNLYKCDKCGQHYHNKCVVCPDKSYPWYQDHPDDRYTSFWNSRAGREAIENAHSWSWDKYTEYKNKDAEEEGRLWQN